MGPILASCVVTVIYLSAASGGSLRGSLHRQSSDDVKYVPIPHAIGTPWPIPMVYSTTAEVQTVNAKSFHFSLVGQSCDLLTSALVRYYKIIFGLQKYGSMSTNNIVDEKILNSAIRSSRSLYYSPKDDAGIFTDLQVNLKNSCEMYPSLEMDESYTLNINKGSGVLTSNSIWGALRGLETFSQLIYTPDGIQLNINLTKIIDKPRFAWRGILLDTSRHFITINSILRFLDAMAYNKMNVFHWHIVDEDSFPYQSVKFPEMSNLGAYNPYTHVYTQTDIARIIELARQRGIRVVPEFDSPGHIKSWGYAIKNLLTPCYSKGNLTGTYGPANPILPSTYEFMSEFFEEITSVFKDKYVHLGGDEVSFSCWSSNPNIAAFMEKMKFGKDYRKLESYYIQKLLNIVESYNASYVVWQEVFDNKVEVSPDTVVEIWLGGSMNETARITAAGLRTILAAPWYLNYIGYGSDWTHYYKAEPVDFNGTAAQKALVLGGEACMWGEYVDATNLESRLWPRASAVAERLWSPQTANNVTEAMPRLEAHRCRMILRGIMAEPPSGPGYCPVEAVQPY